jgi:hypothetical protein
MKDIKFYIGPVTQNVIDAVIEFAEENNVRFGFIPSRRQIEWNNGYVGYNTYDFINYVKSKTNKVLVCRDHSGLQQGYKIGPTYEDLYSMIYDAKWNMDIIHIDPWKKYSAPRQYELGLRETINNIFLINQINNKIKFEVGTEEAIKSFSTIQFYDFLDDLQFQLGKIWENVQYAVVQSGTRLLGTKNTGNFNLEKLQKYVEICKFFNICSKEHNGDYLSNDEIKIRFDNGLNAINIAPEFGVIETTILLDNTKNDDDFEKIYNICLNGEKWKKWVPKEFHVERNKKELIKICGHYHNKEIKQIVNINDNIIKQKIKERLQELINLI